MGKIKDFFKNLKKYPDSAEKPPRNDIGMKCVYAGPKEMAEMSNKDKKEVRTGRVYAGPQSVPVNTNGPVLQQFMCVYAGPEQMYRSELGFNNSLGILNISQADKQNDRNNTSRPIISGSEFFNKPADTEKTLDGKKHAGSVEMGGVYMGPNIIPPVPESDDNAMCDVYAGPEFFERNGGK